MSLMLVLMNIVPGWCWRCWRSSMIPSREDCCVAWGAVGTLGLLDTNTGIPSLVRVDAQVWRDRLTSPGRLEGPGEKLRMVEESGIATLIPGDAHWPRALDDLGERAPYVLFVRGTTSFLARPMNDLVAWR